MSLKRAYKRSLLALTLAMFSTAALPEVCYTGLVKVVVKGTPKISIQKTTSTRSATIGDVVRYRVTIQNTGNGAVSALRFVDTPAAGLTYVADSLTVSGDDSYSITATQPLTVADLDIAVGQTITVNYAMRIGANAGKGTLTNCARAATTDNTVSSDSSCASIERTSNPDFEDTRVLGTVFEDINLNGIQDAGEQGISGVRLMTVEGLLVETDGKGRYHIEGIEASPYARGANYILKVDSHTLPKGSVFTTQNPLVKRITQGLPALYNFGVRTTVDPLKQRIMPNQPISVSSDGFFEFDKYSLSDLQATGRSRLDELLKRLTKDFTSVSRVQINAYTDPLGTDEYNATLSQRRAETLKQYLVQNGIDANVIVAVGKGEQNQIKACAQTERAALIDCLAPNRRSEMTVDGAPVQ